MKKRVLTVICAMLLGTCVSTQAAFQTQVTVVPTSTPHQYRAEFKIIEVGKDGKPTVLATPIMLTNAEQEARAIYWLGAKPENVEADVQDGIICTVLVKETNGGVEAATTVTVKQRGITTADTALNLTVKK
jgi:hypothetical protein